MDRDTWVAGLSGRLREHLGKIPVTGWNKHHIHAACLCARNIHALRALLCKRVEIPQFAVYEAADRGCYEMVELLLAAGADIHASNCAGEEPLQATVRSGSVDSLCTARILVANGARASTMPYQWETVYGTMRIHNSPSGRKLLALIDFERHVGAVRRRVAALLHAKAVCHLVRWDKFLLKEIALQVWAGRTNEGQSP